MRVVIACAVIVLSVLAALGLAQTQNVFSSVKGSIPGTSATAATPSAEPSPKAIVVAKDQERSATASVDTAVVASAPVTGSTAGVPSAASDALTTKSAPVLAQAAPAMAQAAPPAARPAPAPAAAPPQAAACPNNPNGLGVSRVVEID